MSEEASLLSATRTVLPADSPDEGRFYLVVLDGGSSSFFHLPRTGVVLIGRTAEADLRLVDSSISRRHARITLSDGEAQIADLDSHNGTRVNGQPVQGGAPLHSGDVISVGDVTLVFHCGPRQQTARSFLEQRALRQRLEEEIERTLHTEQPLAILLILLSVPGAGPDAGTAAERAARIDRKAVQKTVFRHLRVIDVAGWLGEGQMAVLMPELPGAREHAAREVAEGMLEDLAEFLPAVRAGIASCPQDGCDIETLLSAARSAAESASAGAVRVAEEAATRLSMDGRTILVADPAMVRLFDLIQRLANSELPILVTGETGAGKENAAFAVHYFSPRRPRPFVALNCAALQDTLMESELFGYERGAFSGATHSKPGLLESAAGGTVFLDEVGELSASAQSKLLRALEVKRITRLGDVRERPIDIRVVAATNRNLEEEVQHKRFRQDLFFRLSAATVVLPPLRDRPREIALLSQAFLAQACERAGRPPITITAAAMQKLCVYKWPGNVRELRNAMDYVAVAVPEPLLEVWHLPDPVSGARAPKKDKGPAAPASPAVEPAAAPLTFRPLADEIRELERQRIKEALKAAGGVRKHAAELIGMPLRTFVLRLKQHGLGQGPDQDADG